LKVLLKKGEEDRLLAGHLWVYQNEIQSISGEKEDDIVSVYSLKGKFLGRGGYNPASKIAVRLLTRADEPVDRALFERRIKDAVALRRVLGWPDACRLVFSDADLLPGLIVDKYGDYLVVQLLTLTMDRRREMIASILAETLGPKGILERDDAVVREKEGLSDIIQVLFGEIPSSVDIRENEALMRVDLFHGQKTGHYLDQRQNRAAIRPYVKDRRVLDAFCHTGGFSVHAALYGASDVTAVDASESALLSARMNFLLNGLQHCKTVCANVFDLLKEYEGAGETFDTIILDPPAFCKTKSAVAGAYRGYKEINLRALKLLSPGGFLITFSCSHHMTPELFYAMLLDAARDAGRQCRLIERRMQAADHPASLSSPESLYLKCAILQAL